MGEDSTTTTRTALLARINEIAPLIQQGAFRSEDVGAGMKMRLKRLLRYRGAYLSHILARLGVSRRGDAPATLFWGRTITLPVGDVNTRSLRRFGMLGGEEHRLISFFVHHIKEDDIFYDIGANYGFYSMLAQELIRKGEVHAFEPSEAVFPYLTQIQKEGTFLNQCALADTVGTLSFFDTSSQHQSGKSTLMEEVAGLNRAQGTKVAISATTLDEYCATHTPPTIMKIDVEGGEAKVLAGARATLRRYAPTVAIELWSGERSRFSRSAIELLRELGYSPFLLTSAGGTEPMTFDELEEYLSRNRTDNNFIFQKDRLAF